MNTLITICLILLVYWKLKNLYFSRKDLEMSYRLYDLRDRLRDLVISKKIDSGDWKFMYLDNSISKTISEISGLNLYTAAMLYFKYRNNDKLNIQVANIQEGISKNEHLAVIHTEYGNCIGESILSKHFILRFIVRFGLITVLIPISFIFKFKRAVSLLRFTPETASIDCAA